MLTWEFYRELDTTGALGSCIHYYDTSAQSLYLDNGEMVTKAGKVEEGHWKDQALGNKIVIEDFGYDSLNFDHPHNGILYGEASTDDAVYFLRYVYANDLSDIFDAGQWTEQVDNQVKALSLDVKNVSEELFSADNTLFNPGAKVTLEFTAGESEPYDIGIAYLDDIDFDVYKPTVPINGRNSLGYYLADQSFDDKNIYSGGRSTAIKRILTDAGIPVDNILIKNDDTGINLLFEPQAKILEGVNNTLASINWRMVELPDGRIIIGDEDFITHYHTNGRYTFDGGKQVFVRNTRKIADAAFTRVCVVDMENTMAVYKDIPFWEHWHMEKRKTKYYTAPEGFSKSQMEAMANDLVEQLQYVGIGELFTGPVRPQIQVGDIAEIFYEGDTEAVSLGIMTEIRHYFGERGYSTEFSLDSGGSATDVENYAMTKMSSQLSGYNRRQRITDYINITAEKKMAAVYTGGSIVNVGTSTMPQAASTSPASILRM